MKSFEKWVQKRDLQEQGGLATRTRTIYPRAWNPWSINPRDDVSVRSINPLHRVAANALGGIGAEIVAAADLGGTSGGYDPSTIVRLMDHLKGKGLITDDGYLPLHGVYPVFKEDVPIKEFCAKHRELLAQLSREGFSRPTDLIRRYCEKWRGTAVDDEPQPSFGGYSVDEERLAVEIIQKRMIDEITHKGGAEFINIHGAKPEMQTLKRMPYGGNDYQIEVWVRWPVYEDKLDELRQKLGEAR